MRAPASGPAGLDWHAAPAGQVLDRLEVSREDGLDEPEAARRGSEYGANVLRSAPPRSAAEILAAQLRSLVVLLLVAATVLSWLLGDLLEAGSILVVLVINTLLGFFTELRARRAMEALLRLEVPRATVVRGGAIREVDSRTLVPGDLLVLEPGAAVPADARLVSAVELRTSEAALTGESLPVQKDAAAVLPGDTPLADRVNMVYRPSVVLAGSARAVVVETGARTELGRIGTLVGEIREEKTPLERRLDELGRRLAWLTLAVAAVVVGIGLLRGEPLGPMLETGIALAIAAVPEGLPAVATTALAVGVWRMARRNALVRRLPAVESLGSVTVVCTDKTGTLTAGEMTLVELAVDGRSVEVTGSGFRPEGHFLEDGARVHPGEDPVLELALRIGMLANRADLLEEGGTWRIRGDPTDGAFLSAGRKAAMDREALRRRHPEIGEIPFSSERMLMATFHRAGEDHVAYFKGAPGAVLALCSERLTRDGPQPLDAAGRAAVESENARMAAEGLRVLGLACAPMSPGQPPGAGALTFVGLAGLADPPARGVRETIGMLRDAGIRTVMITGDQRLTADAIARQLGVLREGEQVLDGRELHRLSDDQLAERITRLAVLSRVDPEDKLRIIAAHQARGEVVAMLGDGVNDAAALKKADVGVAMGGRGTDVAKEAAAVVLRDDRFITIAAAVEEGRVIYANIRKFVLYLFSCNLAEVMVILGAGVIGLPQPLSPLQILWLNLATDTFPALSLAMEPSDPDAMRRPPRDPRATLLSARFARAVAFYALLITAVTLAAFLWAQGQDRGGGFARTVAFMTLALAQVLHLGNTRETGPVLTPARVVANRWALAAVVATVALQIAVAYLPPLRTVLGVVPLSLADWMVILPLAALPAVAGQVLKALGIGVLRRGGEDPTRRHALPD